jgi:hypothetical protein
MEINLINIIQIEWNCYNGFVFCVLDLDLNKPNIDSALFGIDVSSKFLYIDILFVTIKVFDNLY